MLAIKKGWNLISIPLLLKDDSIGNILKIANLSYVYAYDSGYYIPSKISYFMGFWIKAENDTALKVDGNEPGNISLNLKQGWNLVGYPSLTIQNITEVYNQSNISVVLAYENNSWKSYSPKKPTTINTMNFLYPGYGYWIKADGNTSLIIS